MKKIYYLLFTAFFSLLACTSEDSNLTPSDISGLTAEPMEGAVLLKWETPADADFLYIRLQYTNTRTNEEFNKNISTYTNEVLVKDLLARDGEYTFRMTTVSADETYSPNSCETKCTCLPVLPKTTTVLNRISLAMDANKMRTNAQSPSEGPLSNLIDGKDDTHFHSDYSSGRPPAPHYVEFQLLFPLPSFVIKTITRKNNDGGSPEDFELMVSSDGTNWTTLQHEVNYPKGQPYTSPVLTADQPFSYIRYSVNKRTGGKADYFNLAELELHEAKITTYDPEHE